MDAFMGCFQPFNTCFQLETGAFDFDHQESSEEKFRWTVFFSYERIFLLWRHAVRVIATTQPATQPPTSYHHHAPFNISPTHHRLQPFRISILKTNSLIHIPKKPCRRTQKSEARDSGSNGSGKRGRRGRQGAGTAEEAVGRAPYFSDRCVPEGAVHI